ncbi:MAG: MFS transporter [Candidatus Hodarchaeota archaeon]
MEDDYEIKRDKTFNRFLILHYVMYFSIMILPVNINNLLLYLPGTTAFGIGIIVATHLTVVMISILFFGYYGEKISEKFSRKKIFVFTNFIWVLSYGLISLSINYYYFLIFVIIGSFGIGAFLPIGFSMIGDFYPPGERGRKFGAMNVSLLLGTGGGIIIGGLLGNYTWSFGWRIAYGIGCILGLLALLSYVFSGISPERGRAEPEFMDFKGEINYNYKITFHSLGQLFKKKTVAAILIAMIFSGFANVTLGTWAIFYLTSKIDDVNAGLYATTIFILAGIGAIPGTIIGGKFGDSYFNTGKLRGRVSISLIGLILGILCLLGFYLIPFFTANSLQIVFSWIFFIALGFVGFLLTSLCVGNILAIYSEVCVPELRSTANALNGFMINIGGIIGNLLLSFLIDKDMALFPFAIMLVLLFWLFGSVLWIIPYFIYPKECNELRDLMAERRKELEMNSELS